MTATNGAMVDLMDEDEAFAALDEIALPAESGDILKWKPQEGEGPNELRGKIIALGVMAGEFEQDGVVKVTKVPSFTIRTRDGETWGVAGFASMLNGEMLEYAIGDYAAALSTGKLYALAIYEGEKVKAKARDKNPAKLGQADKYHGFRFYLYEAKEGTMVPVPRNGEREVDEGAKYRPLLALGVGVPAAVALTVGDQPQRALPSGDEIVTDAVDDEGSPEWIVTTIERWAREHGPSFFERMKELNEIELAAGRSGYAPRSFFAGLDSVTGKVGRAPTTAEGAGRVFALATDAHGELDETPLPAPIVYADDEEPF